MQKNNFILYTDYFEQLQMLTIEQRGVLLTALMCYQLGEQLPEMDKITAMCYSFISADVRRNNEKYEEIIEKRRESGRRGGKQTQANKANAYLAKANQANQASASDNVNVNVNVNDNVNDNDNVNVSGSVNDNVHTDTTTTTTQRDNKTTSLPTLEQLKIWCRINGINTNLEKFYAYNEARGWTLNGKPAEWQALLKLWCANDKDKGRAQDQPAAVYDFDAIERELVNKI